MARQDDFVRITLRLPQELHEKLMAAARVNSLNAEIVRRLEHSFGQIMSDEEWDAASHQSPWQLIRLMRSAIDDLEKIVDPDGARDREGGA
ncbi:MULTISPECIES: Arc family DNA-binding protein [unclassified Xanthobacter]|uniref:Arc family DNA-binding protein n=1 Tax=unclassified Xanthobacter TaxID=2623496 RepID=UPI001F27D656|nr:MULTISPECIES: Arc family DNA-binding protein [unclassified Xanthobacter]